MPETIAISPRAPLHESAHKTPFALLCAVVALFFIWGGITSLIDILIPKLKGLFQLTYAQAMLTQFAFFTAYAVVSLPAGALVARLGYGRGIVTGLLVIAAGCLTFVPAASLAAYSLFLAALFIVAAGITILQVAANPLIAQLGPAGTSHSRLTFAQAFNSLGTAICPWVGAQVILGSIASVDPATLKGAERTAFQAREAAVIGQTYVAIALVLLALAASFWFVRDRLGNGSAAAAGAQGGALAQLRRPRLAFGVLAIFLYVGAEVTIGSVMVNYLMQRHVMDLPALAAGELLALYWTGAMLGRFAGAPVLRLVAPGKVLAGAAIAAAALTLISASASGPLAGWTLLAVGLANAIMFPTIFTLAVEGLGEKTPQGSGLLCTAIVGGAIVPVASGAVADALSLSMALVIPALCYGVIACYGWYARHRGKGPGEPADG